MFDKENAERRRRHDAVVVAEGIVGMGDDRVERNVADELVGGILGEVESIILRNVNKAFGVVIVVEVETIGISTTATVKGKPKKRKSL